MTDPLTERLDRKSAAELVSDRLMQLIVAGVLKAGEPLRETQLSERLGISRNSLREGIRLLERSRLVKYEMHRGAIVSDPSLSDLEDLYRTRRHLETAAIRAAPTQEGLDRLRAAWEHLEASTSVPSAEPIVAADLALHQAIVALLESERMSTFYAAICKELVFYFSVISHADEEYRNPQAPIIDRHREIVEAILERRVADAERLTLQHIDENENRLADILRARAHTP